MASVILAGGILLSLGFASGMPAELGENEGLKIAIVEPDDEVLDSSDSVRLLVQLSNETTRDVAFCWNGSISTAFLGITWTRILDGSEGRATPDETDFRLIAVDRDVLILPKGHSVLARVPIEGSRFAREGRCEKYQLRAVYSCPSSLLEDWRGEPELVVGRIESDPVPISVDDRSLIGRMLRGCTSD